MHGWRLGSWIVLLAALTSGSVLANLPAAEKWRKPGFGFDIPRDLMSEWLVGWNKTYRIGSEWGKKSVTVGQLESESQGFRRMAMATGTFRSATAFYLGRFNGKHIVATNHHVLEKESQCAANSVRFPWLELRLQCESFIGSWTDVDLAFFSVKVLDAASEKKLEDVRGSFAFNEDVYTGQELLTIGFGFADNPLREMMANQDSDCKVFSERNDFHFMGDPDELNPGPYKAWSFSNGCDVSHGDSGSAMVDRRSGKIVGIIWTGRIPKKTEVQDSAYLAKMLDKPTDDLKKQIWSELSYAVPSKKMKEFLTTLTEDPTLGDEVRETILAILSE